jgi:cytochrome d ubiquinol oxidase subunit II
MTEMLASAWIVIIAFCILMYVLLDGFDLGIGILFPFFKDSHDRNVLLSAILPFWDGNQTWLVLGGASLYGAFPYAFSMLLPALYLPLYMMMMALLLRGITFEFRLKAKGKEKHWDTLFFLSSLGVTICQGLVLGTFIKGFDLDPRSHELHYALFTSFNITCSVALVFGYVLLGSTWVIGKTSGDLQSRMFVIAKKALCIVTVFLLVISAWTPFVDPSLLSFWLNPQYMYKLAILPFVTGLMIFYAFYALYQGYEYIVFWLSIGIFACCYLGFGLSSWPYLIPHVTTIWQAAAPASSLSFMLVGAVILLPILIGYTSYAYYVFRGKITEIIEY